MILEKIRKKIFSSPKASPAAYDLWAPIYDQQSGNLMLHLDREIFSSLLSSVDLKNRTVLDIGCGTGRHWPAILAGAPARLTGYDVSPGMLHELKKKIPDAHARLATDNLLTEVLNDSVDVLITTLTIAHIKNLEEVFTAWSRVLKTGGHILLTDYHPQLLASGGKRDFAHRDQKVVIRNYVHTLEKMQTTAAEKKLEAVRLHERFIDEKVKHFYEEQNALALYDRFRGSPVIYGLHLKKL